MVYCTQRARMELVTARDTKKASLTFGFGRWRHRAAVPGRIRVNGGCRRGIGEMHVMGGGKERWLSRRGSHGYRLACCFKGFAQHRSQGDVANKRGICRWDQQKSRDQQEEQVSRAERMGPEAYKYMRAGACVCLARQAEPAAHQAQYVRCEGPLVSPCEAESRQSSVMQQRGDAGMPRPSVVAVFLILAHRANDGSARCRPERLLEPIGSPPTRVNADTNRTMAH
jgi:hypothetical protein